MDEIANNQQPKITGLLKSTIVLAVIVTIMSLIIFSSVTHELLLPGIYYLLYLFLIIVFFTLSILSLYTIIKKNSGLKGTAAVWLSMLVVLFFLLFLACLYLNRVRTLPPPDRDMINLHSLGIALEFYQIENDGKYPSEYKWCDLLKEYDIEKEFICPADEIAGERCSYAMNPYCKPNSPPDIVLLFESKPGWNRSGGPQLLNPNKHYKRNWLWGYKIPGCYILFNDKHVEFVYDKDFNDLKWK